MRIEGKCNGCRAISFNLKAIQIVTGYSFLGVSNLSTSHQVFCPDCVNREYFYIDKDGFVKLNKVKVTKTSSITEENKHVSKT